MATKVMLAPAIARREADLRDAEKQGAVAEAKPKRRRSSVFDCEGNEVFITLMCVKCHRMRPLSQFGLRRMADGAIRNQPWCRACRGGTSVESPRRKRHADKSGDPSVSGESPVAEGSAPERIIDPGTLAAQVVAALSGGRR